MSKSIEHIEERIEEELKFTNTTFNVDILDKATGKYHNLLDSNEELLYEFQNKEYTFTFSHAIFVEKIHFKGPENVDLKDLEIIYNNELGEEHNLFFKKGHSKWIPNRVIKGFKIKVPKRTVFNRIKLSNINIVGYQLEQLSEISKQFRNLSSLSEELKSKIKQIKNSEIELTNKISETENIIDSKEKKSNEVLENLENKINEKETQLELLVEDEKDYINITIPSLEKSKEELQVEVNKLEDTKNSLSSENTNLSNNVKQLESKTDSLNMQISQQQEELRKLTEDTNIFATEMKEYISQGNNDIKLYTKLSVLPWLIIAVVSSLVFWGTSELTTVYSLIIDGKLKNVDIATIFWSRIPFAIIVISILFVCFEVSKIFIKNIIHIHKQKRIFTKIGIIAKDVAEQSILGLELDEKEKFHLRTKLKMDLLKNHLKNDIGEDYDYKVKTSVIDYYNDFKIRKEEKKSKQNNVEKNTENTEIESDT